mmetsp:Transcript_31579/g.57801  ORF Transcript_31579/g.57801 Transcript_31579/m.57801 type:complete len:221 (+) Transcript_31579:1395-2057(+)
MTAIRSAAGGLGVVLMMWRTIAVTITVAITVAGATATGGSSALIIRGLTGVRRCHFIVVGWRIIIRHGTSIADSSFATSARSGSRGCWLLLLWNASFIIVGSVIIRHRTSITSFTAAARSGSRTCWLQIEAAVLSVSRLRFLFGNHDQRARVAHRSGRIVSLQGIRRRRRRTGTRTDGRTRTPFPIRGRSARSPGPFRQLPNALGPISSSAPGPQGRGDR